MTAIGDPGPEDPSGQGETRRIDESSGELPAPVMGGDDAVLERLCTRYLPRLRRWAMDRSPRWPRDRLATDDLVQETLLQTIHRLDAFEPRGEGALQVYVRQALLNRIRDEIRRIEPQAPPPSPLDETIGREAVARYETALGRLGDEDREAIIARVELRFSYEEIAGALGQPSSDAARKAVSRALLRLAEEMSRA